MKLILLLIVLCACFWSARFIKCRGETVGTVEQHYVNKKPTNFSGFCPKDNKVCVKNACFRDGKANDYVTVYSCANSIKTNCSISGPRFLAMEECTEKGNGNKEACAEEKGKNEAAFVKKYGNYRCEQCQFGNENEDYGNANFPLYKPKESGGTVNGISHLLVMIFAAVALFGTAIGHGHVL
ncbi:hypothetical protein niasHT_010845 [Heterodera trifolii]|uniref:Uncharacterized protein n=1 Tax=Heterodera trifolii TaxID=157864 RepID=A0ABD2LDW7_9BILA